MNWYLKALRQYADFSGRATRQEFWMFVLFNIIFSVFSTLIDYSLGTGFEGGGIISSIYSLAVLIPSLAVTVRRLHDIGKSGWNILLGLIPLIGFIILIVYYATDSEFGDNKWGPDPKPVGGNQV